MRDDEKKAAEVYGGEARALVLRSLIRPSPAHASRTGAYVRNVLLVAIDDTERRNLRRKKRG